jgi:hypothetical protein
MTELPALPLEPNGILPPVALLLQWLASLPASRDEVELVDLPHVNGCLPGLLRLGGIPRLMLHQRLPVHSFTWEGQGGGRVLVNSRNSVVEEAPLHHGPLPNPVWPVSDINGRSASLVESIRLADVQAVHGIGPGAAWDAVLEALRQATPASSTPLTKEDKTDGLGAWNPLPFARRGVVSLAVPPGPFPWSMSHAESGATYPVQVVEGPLGSEMLVELPLGALSAQRLTPGPEPVSGAMWEVSAEVIDNGLVRAELDVHGQVERLCFGGRFVELAGPLVRPLLQTIQVGDRPAEIRVLEDGPVRARVTASRETTLGVLHVTYTLLAHEGLLRVAVAWDGAIDAGLIIDHPTSLRHGEFRIAGELASEVRHQTPSIGEKPAEPIPGCRWAMISDGHGGGLAVLAQRTLSVGARAGHLRLPYSGQLGYALADPGIVNLSQAALACAIPLRPYYGDMDLPAPFRLVGDTGVAALWVRAIDADTTELTLAEQLVRRSRLWIYPRKHPTEAWRSDVAGKRLSMLPLTAEGDGIQVDLQPGELALIRWH